MNEMYKIVKFNKGDKWLVLASKEIDNVKYLYLAKLNKTEDDILDEYKVVHHNTIDGKNIFTLVKDKEELKKIMPILVPESSEYINNPDLLSNILRLS